MRIDIHQTLCYPPQQLSTSGLMASRRRQFLGELAAPPYPLGSRCASSLLGGAARQPAFERHQPFKLSRDPTIKIDNSKGASSQTLTVQLGCLMQPYKEKWTSRPGFSYHCPYLYPFQDLTAAYRHGLHIIIATSVWIKRQNAASPGGAPPQYQIPRCGGAASRRGCAVQVD